MATSEDEETCSCAGDASMQVDPEDLAADGQSVSEIYCQPCRDRNKARINLSFGRCKERSLKEQIDIMRGDPVFSETLYPHYQTTVKEAIELEARNNELEGELNSLPLCADANCYGRSVRNSDEIRRAKNLDNRERDFISPQRRKTARINQVLKSPNKPIETRNAFEPLNNETENQEAIRQNNDKPEQVPPIMLRYNSDYLKILEDIRKACEPTDNKFANGLIKIFPETQQKHTEISNFCRTQGYDFHVIKPVSKRLVKAVIKHLPPDHDVNNIKYFLKNELNFPVERVIQLTKLRTRKLLPFYLVELQRTPKSEEIFQIKHVNYLKVEVERYKGRNIVNQCYKCNWYHHKAGECESKVRCLKCAGPHETNKCSITDRIINPKCINCGETGHVASFRGCSAFPKPPINQQSRLNNLNSQQRTFNTNANRVRENFSYSRALNPHPQQQMAPRIPSIESSQPIDIPTNAFRDMAEGIVELKKLLQEFPNLFSALKELKTARSTAEKLNILVKAFDSGTSVSG
ncbi:hypothetical protein AVEN_167543-1 [Araneus ventricosus]|uniref:Pre-C2HC domain-containing protein n=1 Tax=Araneus ventricosus TaxID=182803 RepID=A0A4Y2TQZ7_ARAVE|nr:hypothetical protein AVEN_167543-1 [Araneus ventricosus]